MILSGERPTLPKSESDCPKSLASLVIDCWQQDPLKRLDNSTFFFLSTHHFFLYRPSFTEILERFDKDILVDSAILDTNGRKFWKENFLLKKGNKFELRFKKKVLFFQKPNNPF